MAIDVNCPKGTWRATGAYLTTWEAVSLANWLESISRDHPESDSVDFTEPDLGFAALTHSDGSIELHVLLGAEFKPPWSGRSMGQEALVFNIAPPDLTAAARDLKSQLGHFSQR